MQFTGKKRDNEYSPIMGVCGWLHELGLLPVFLGADASEPNSWVSWGVNERLDQWVDGHLDTRFRFSTRGR
jgi:hypothetical protein